MSSLASQKTGVGKILRLSVSADSQEAIRTMEIEGFNKSGVNCYQSGATNVMAIRFENNHLGDSQYSMALAAHLAKKKVRVKVDDSKMIGIHCTVQLIQLCENDQVCI